MTTLKSELQNIVNNFNQNSPKEIIDLVEQSTKELANSNLAKGLAVGNKAPDFTLPSANSETISLYEQLKKGPVILSFYRGGWCPYCNLELNAYQKVLSDIHASGAELIAVSPQTPDASLTTQEKNNLKFIVLSDVGAKVAAEYQLVFKLPDEIIEIYKGWNLDIPAHNGNDSWQLPVPATFVIDQAGVIRFANVDPDYTHRAEPSEVINFIKQL